MSKKFGIDKTLLLYVTLNVLISTGELLMDIGVQLLIIKAASFYNAPEDKITNSKSVETEMLGIETKISNESRLNFDSINIGYLDTTVNANSMDEISDITREDPGKENTVEQSELAASYLMYNRVLLEISALILLPVYSITLSKW